MISNLQNQEKLERNKLYPLPLEHPRVECSSVLGLQMCAILTYLSVSFFIAAFVFHTDSINAALSSHTHFSQLTCPWYHMPAALSRLWADDLCLQGYLPLGTKGKVLTALRAHHWPGSLRIDSRLCAEAHQSDRPLHLQLLLRGWRLCIVKRSETQQHPTYKWLNNTSEI